MKKFITCMISSCLIFILIIFSSDTNSQSADDVVSVLTEDMKNTAVIAEIHNNPKKENSEIEISESTSNIETSNTESSPKTSDGENSVKKNIETVQEPNFSIEWEKLTEFKNNARDEKDYTMIKDFECILQNPELPTGCELTALDMVLNYYGCGIDKVALARNYLPMIKSGIIYNNENIEDIYDANNYFIGDPETTGGFVAGTGAIMTAANSYLSAIGSELTAKDITGQDFDQLYKYVENKIPVVVWVTIAMVDRPQPNILYVFDGSYVEWTTQDHGAVLIGYSDDTVIIADPISGIYEFDKKQFESVYASRGYRGVVVS